MLLYILTITFLDIFLARIHYKYLIHEHITQDKKALHATFKSEGCHVNDQ